MDAIFKALSDDTRRQLLDMLREKDGQTLSELEGKLGMSRFGVMKHLKILEEASLVVTRKSGRFKYHYLNAVPLQTVIDRWIDPLVQKPMSRLVLDLKTELEGDDPMSVDTNKDRPDLVLETFIKASVERVWDALTNPETIVKHHYAANAVSGSFSNGDRAEYLDQKGNSFLAFEILDEEPGKRLDMTFEPGFFGPGAKHSRCVYELEEQGALCKLTILHFNIPEEQKDTGIGSGWASVASGLKTWLETVDNLFGGGAS